MLFELGVGFNTPSIIKYPFWNMAKEYPHTMYVCINKETAEEEIPGDIKEKSICIKGDCSLVIAELLKLYCKK